VSAAPEREPVLPRAAAALRAIALGPGRLPLAVFLLHVFLSRVVFAYRAVPWLDVPMHFAGGWVIAWFLERALATLAGRGLVEPVGRALAAALVFGWTAAAALGWEVAEYTSDALGITSAQLGLDDTMVDMMLGVAGGIVYLVGGPRAVIRGRG
jgi:hypothetical protein